jgi:hypothetical protein
LFVFTKGAFVTSKEIQEKVKDYCERNKDVAQSFGCQFVKDEAILNTKSKDYWKWTEFLRSKGVENKTIRQGNKTAKAYFNLKLK